MTARLSPQRETEIRELVGPDVISRIWRAVAAPGSFTPRHSDAETESGWQARAVLMVIGENHFAKRDLLAELAAARAERDHQADRAEKLGRQLRAVRDERNTAEQARDRFRNAWQSARGRAAGHWEAGGWIRAERDEACAQFEAERAAHRFTLRQRNNRSNRIQHLRDLANAAATGDATAVEKLITAARDTLAASRDDHTDCRGEQS